MAFKKINRVLEDTCKEKDNQNLPKTFSTHIFQGRSDIGFSFQKFSVFRYKGVNYLFAFGEPEGRRFYYNSALIAMKYPNKDNEPFYTKRTCVKHFLEKKKFNEITIFGLNNGQVWVPKTNEKLSHLLQEAMKKTNAESVRRFGIPVLCENLDKYGRITKMITYSGEMSRFLRQAILLSIR